jgi:hypothetical protein
MSEQLKTAIFLLDDGEGQFSIDLRLSHDPTAETSVPPLDILTLALTYLVVSADSAVDAAIQHVHGAYETLKNNPDPIAATQAFNEAVGVKIYDVKQSNQNDAS